MKAGRELDALVAEKVMGLEVSDGNVVRDNKRSGIPPYSRDMNFTWQVVEKLKKDNIYIDIYSLPLNGYRVEATTHDGEQYVHLSTVGADTAQLAICLAAFKAVGVKLE